MTNAQTKTAQKRTSTRKTAAKPAAPKPEAEEVAEAASSAPEQADEQSEVVAEPEDKVEESSPAEQPPEEPEPEPEPEPEEVLLCAILVKAKKKMGFWRAGRFWSKEGSHAFVVKDGQDIDAIKAENPDIESAFLTEAEHQRLENEPLLVVEVLEKEDA